MCIIFLLFENENKGMITIEVVKNVTKNGKVSWLPILHASIVTKVRLLLRYRYMYCTQTLLFTVRIGPILEIPTANQPGRKTNALKTCKLLATDNWSKNCINYAESLKVLEGYMGTKNSLLIHIWINKKQWTSSDTNPWLINYLTSSPMGQIFGPT